eukprot:6193671-Pleurochrysis_carterae.AAC.4
MNGTHSRHWQILRRGATPPTWKLLQVAKEPAQDQPVTGPSQGRKSLVPSSLWTSSLPHEKVLEGGDCVRAELARMMHWHCELANEKKSHATSPAAELWP